MDKISKKNQMINKRIKLLRSKFIQHKIDGYVVPKNDQFFSEYAAEDRLKIISNFSGSAGLAIVLKKISYLFVDGRYTIQAQQQSGKKFKIIANPAEPLKFEIIFNLSLTAYSEKNSSFFGTIYPSILC